MSKSQVFSKLITVVELDKAVELSVEIGNAYKCLAH